MSTVIDCARHDHIDRHQRWDRFERADVFEHSLELQAQGLSQRQAAKQLQVPRTTLQAWRRWHATLDICPHVAQFFQSERGLAFLHRLVLALHLVCVEVGACGMRLVCLLLTLTGLDRFVAASYGAQQQVNRQVEDAIVTYNHTETARLVKDMPQKDMTLATDETFTGGLCLVAIEPVSTFIILEQLAQSRDHATWHEMMAPVLAPLNCQVIQLTSDEAPGLLAYVEHHLGAHHSPDVFHVQQELVKAVSGPLATTQRAASKAVTETQERLEQVHRPLPSTGDAPQPQGTARCPTNSRNLEQAEREAQAARQELERISAQREQVAQRIRRIGQAYHCVDLERGVRRNGQLIAADIHQQIDMVRTIAQQEGLSQPCVERIEKAARVVPNMQATIDCVSGYVHQQVRQLNVTPATSCVMHARLIPAYSLWNAWLTHAR